MAETQGPEIGLSSTVALSSVLHADVSFSHFWISQGTVNDADYASDNRAVKTADYDFKANRGQSSNIRAEIFTQSGQLKSSHLQHIPAILVAIKPCICWMA
ncbi:hypothetical protein KUH03_41685 [Sphingobacterium sp. E70]|uniref:hypothetical protein n=1 Tax=Sphingobacterium sp. E70 TaxID=2853439 RepID=UPI00211D0A34|nr:hypothetical protein [Sphingobacterium sp. E70]ULT25263.1 hypothetical protein KUH03_41685 [Sphingobacterium sp. E70]